MDQYRIEENGDVCVKHLDKWVEKYCPENGLSKRCNIKCGKCNENKYSTTVPKIGIIKSEWIVEEEGTALCLCGGRYLNAENKIK